MKKTTFYKVGALCLSLSGLGLFTAFDDSMTDDQKIEQAVQTLTDEFMAAQDALCKEQALAAAQAQWDQMQQTSESSGGVEEQPTGSGNNYQGGTNDNASGDEQPPVTAGGTSGSTDDKKTGKLGVKNSDRSDGGGKLNVKNDGSGGKSGGGKLNAKAQKDDGSGEPKSGKLKVK